MATVTTTTPTPFNGGDKFPTTMNDVYGLVEKLAVQNITALKGANPIANAFFEYDIDGNGNVIEESVIEMAEAGTFDKTTPNFAPKDPTLKVRYFNNWTPKQFKTTIRKDDIRKVIADGKGESVEGVTAKILQSLNEGEAFYDMGQMCGAISTVAQTHASALSSVEGYTLHTRSPKNLKGLIFAIREAYNALKSTNTTTTRSGSIVSGKYAVDPKDIRIAITETVLDLIDITELANVFNLEKEQLFGMIVKIPAGGMNSSFVLVYDVRAMGRGTRVYDYSQDVVGSTRYSNHYLTTERCYFFNPLFKAIMINGSQALTDAINGVLVAPAS